MLENSLPAKAKLSLFVPFPFAFAGCRIKQSGERLVGNSVENKTSKILFCKLFEDRDTLCYRREKLVIRFVSKRDDEIQVEEGGPSPRHKKEIYCGDMQ